MAVLAYNTRATIAKFHLETSDYQNLIQTRLRQDLTQVFDIVCMLQMTCVIRSSTKIQISTNTTAAAAAELAQVVGTLASLAIVPSHPLYFVVHSANLVPSAD